MTSTLRRYMLGAMMLLAAGTATAQELNSGYFNRNFKYRHDINPALGNDKFYFAIPGVGGLNLRLQGNLGVQDVLFPAPAGSSDKSLVTFMHPSLTDEEALAGINDKNKYLFDTKVTVLSLGFKAFKGYNTLEVNVRNHFGIYLPGDLLRMARGLKNQVYNFDFGVRDRAYGEVAIGHSRQINDKLRAGMKLKALVGAGMAEVMAKGMEVDFRADQQQWAIHSGELTADVYLKGLTIGTKTEEYSDGHTEQVADLGEIDLDSPGVGGFGGAVDLGVEYKVFDGLNVSAAVTDLGFIKWKNAHSLVQPSKDFTFDGFHDIRINDDNPGGKSFDEQTDKYEDQLSDFLNVKDTPGEDKTKGLAPTVTVGAEYQMPFYKKLSVGVLGQHHFDGEYSWSEARASVNFAPLRLFAISGTAAVNDFGTSFGGLVNLNFGIADIYVGMDHIITKVSKQYVPLKSNANVNVGMMLSF